MGKVVSVTTLARIAAQARKQKKTIVFTNGCFDILHRGHIWLLNKAASFADILVVGLNSDSSVRRLKGKGRPVKDQLSRGQILAALSMVDYVTVFTQDTPLELIKRLKPDVLVKGGDWKTGTIVGADEVKSTGGSVRRVSYRKGCSSTALIRKIGRNSER